MGTPLLAAAARSRQRLALLGALLVVGSVAILILQRPGRDRIGPADRFRPVVAATDLDSDLWRPVPATAPRPAPPRPARWLIVCWDGASWDLLLPLLAAGRMPHLAALMAEGVYGNLSTIQPTASPVVWTTIATGVRPDRHGVLGFLNEAARGDRGRQPDARAPLYRSSDRRAKAIWELLSENGRRALVIGYHNTFPAEPLAGVMVSNYLVRRHHTARFQARDAGAEAALESLVYPREALSELAALERPLGSLRWEEMRRFASVDRPTFEVLMSSREGLDGELGQWAYLCKAYAYDGFHARAALRWLPKVAADVALVHFQALDWAGHHFLFFHWPDRFLNRDPLRAALEADAPVYGNTLTALHEYLDEVLGRLREAVDASTAVMVLSDHGIEPGPDLYRGDHEGAPPGILVMAGPGLRRGVRLQSATVYDILPTILATLGLPLARDLDGRVLEEAFDPTARIGRAASIASYGPRRSPPAAPGHAEALERAVEDELRAIGYIR